MAAYIHQGSYLNTYLLTSVGHSINSDLSKYWEKVNKIIEILFREQEISN